MEQPLMLHEEDKYDFNVWYTTFDPVFSEISKKSRLPEKWTRYEYVLKGKYSDSVIKPINKYVEALYPRPELVSIVGNTVTLRQGNHAEFFLLIKKGGEFFNLDRPWMRQYYRTKNTYDRPENCFLGYYKFYVPWFIDEDIEVRYVRPDVESPFFIQESSASYKKTDKTEVYVEPHFVNFSFKNVGKHMVSPKFGKIKRQQPMFDMVFEADDIMIQRVRNFYEQD